MIVAPPDVIKIANKSVYGTHLRMLSKMDLRVRLDTKSGQLKNALGIAPKCARQDRYKDAEKGAPENALKSSLQVALGLHLFIPVSMNP